MSINTEIESALEDLRKKAWSDLCGQVKACTKCPLHRTRRNTVFGEGPTENCRCVIIGEAPGVEEDRDGKPFVGKAGILLNEILSANGIPRESVYIMNVLKCRPPSDDPKKQNRPPKSDEINACKGYLEAQLLLLHPDIIVTMGNTPTKFILETDKGITAIRGKWCDKRGIKILPMFHPSYLLHGRNDPDSPDRLNTFADAKKLKAALDWLKSH